MLNAKNPVSRLQFGLEIHFSLYFLVRAHNASVDTASHLQV